MADKTIGELKRATSLDDDSLLIAEQQGEALSVTGRLFKSFAQESTKEFAESASADAATAVGAKDAAQSALKGVQDALNNLPAGGTVVINDLTTGGTTAALSAEMGKELNQKTVPITRKVNGKDLSSDIVLSASDVGASNVNPNLLHNWYFANPVNQRGQTEYTGNLHVYTIDRWKFLTANGTMRVGADGVTLIGGTDGARFSQYLENLLLGETITFSAIVSETSGSDWMMIYATVDGTDQQVASKIISSVGCDSITGTIPKNATRVFVRVQTAKTSGASLTIKAAKLELGSTQTLAHQDENGNWVLNEIPDYGEELRKCQRYFYNPLHGGSDDKAQAFLGIGHARSITEIDIHHPLPCSMRVHPTISGSGLKVFQTEHGVLDVSDVSGYATAKAYNNTNMMFIAHVEGATLGAVYELFAANSNATLTFDADL